LTSIEVGAVCLPKPGEDVCGDAWTMHRDGDKLRVLLADGLGHGLGAADAANAAAARFAKAPHLPLLTTLGGIHDELRQTRGAVLGLAEIDFARRELLFTGVGNIEGSIYSEAGSHGVVSHNGTVGFEMGRVQQFTYSFPDDAIFVMHSDGCTTQL